LLHTYISLNRQADALEQVNIISSIAQQYPQYLVYAHLAQARYDIAVRNFPHAASEFEQAIKLSPYDADTHYQLGAVYITLGKYKDAYNEMQKTLELEPNNNQALSALAMLRNYLQKNNP
jgi:Flp pilus assembly protein TadD